MTGQPPDRDERWRVVESMEEAARRAAEFIRSRAAHRDSLAWESKAPADFVSEVDRGAEERIRALLLERHPEARILGEELTPDAAPDAGMVFVVDPLDGTTNFLHGYPWYAVSIACARDGALEAAMVHNVVTGERFAAARGLGAWRNDDERLRVSPITDTNRALIGTGFPFKSMARIDEYTRQFAAVARETAGMRRAGSAALDLCDVACGRFEGFWELTLSPWDYAAGVLMIREAGGVVTDLDGNDPALRHSGLVAGSPVMHAWLMKTLTTND